MSGGDAASVLFYGVMVVLPLAALVARRPPLGQTLKFAGAWVAIFLAALLLVGQRDRFAGIARLFSDQRVTGGETRLRMAADGHFWAEVRINGVARRMLVDSGATTTALSVATARAARLDLDESPFATVIETANGAVTARTATAARVEIGSIVARDLGVVVSPAFGDTDVLGMNFLSTLGGWQVREGTLVLSPPQR